MTRLILLVRRARQEHGARAIERHDAVRLRVPRTRRVRGFAQASVILDAIVQRPRRAAAEQVLLDERERAADERPELRDAGAEVAAAMQLVPEPRRAHALVVARELRVGRRAVDARAPRRSISAASIPLFSAVCEPLILAGFRNPASQPTSTPPGNVNFGSDCSPPLLTARAPYEMRSPPASSSRIARMLLPALELGERIEMRIAIAQAHDETRRTRARRRRDRRTRRRRSRASSGQPSVCTISPGRCFAASICQISLKPSP